jgi:hypothetical protein
VKETAEKQEEVVDHLDEQTEKLRRQQEMESEIKGLRDKITDA